MPKVSVIVDAFERIDAAVPNGAAAALHIRRLHLLTDTGLQLNRFESYCSTSMCEAFRDMLLEEAGTRPILLASDCGTLVRDLKQGRFDRVISLDDVLDVKPFTGIQQALIDIYFLSRAPIVYGPKSAFGVVAAMIGGGEFRNMLITFAQKEIGGTDETGAVQYLKHEFSKRAAETFRVSPQDNDQSALLCNLARRLLGEQGSPDMTLETALRAVAVRFSQYRHPCFFGDCRGYLETAKQAADYAGAAELARKLDAIEKALLERDATHLFSESPSATTHSNGMDTAAAMAEFVRLVVAMDCFAIRRADAEAIDYLLRSLDLAAQLGVGTRGLHLRGAPIYRQLGMPDQELQALTAAVTIDPHYADANFILSEALNTRGSREAALEHAHRAVELDPANAPFRFHLARLLAESGRTQEARAAMEETVLCEPQNERYLAALGAMPNT